MEVYHGLGSVPAPAAGAVLTIGNFDGVHRGHAALVATAQRVAARCAAPVLAVTFDPHPLAVLAPERAPAPLTTLAEKLALLERLGVGHAAVLRSEPALLTQQAGDFLASLVAHCRPRALVEGPDFSFGRGRGGNVDTLRAHSERWGYEVHEVPAVRCTELPTHPTISSSSIRQALVDGRVDEAGVMLGRPYRVVGRTGHGAGRGATLGFPTANVDGIVHLLPQQAVYAAVAQLDDETLYLAAVNVGPQPTFDQARCRVEAHLLDFHADVRGRAIGLHFLARLREQSRFAGPEDLIRQIRRDVEATRGFADRLADLKRSGPVALM